MKLSVKITLLVISLFIGFGMLFILISNNIMHDRLIASQDEWVETLVHAVSEDITLKTINGDVKINFQPDLSADFWLKTFTGDAFSDFPVSYLPSRPGKEARKNGKFVYKSNNTTGLRIGKGGPEIKMDTMTGDILIEKEKFN